jgi:hypothetical protein
MHHGRDQTYSLWQIESWARETGRLTEGKAAAKLRRDAIRGVEA